MIVAVNIGGGRWLVAATIGELSGMIIFLRFYTAELQAKWDFFFFLYLLFIDLIGLISILVISRGSRNEEQSMRSISAPHTLL